MLLITANRRLLQNLLRKHPACCVALESAVASWQEDSLSIACQNKESQIIIVNHLRNNSVAKPVFQAIPTKKIIITFSPEIKIEYQAYELPPMHPESATSPSTLNPFLRVESGLLDDNIKDIDMTSALLEAPGVQNQNRESSLELKKANIGEMVEMMSAFVNLPVEDVTKELLMMQFPEDLVNSLRDAFFRERMSAVQRNGVNHSKKVSEPKTIDIEAKTKVDASPIAEDTSSGTESTIPDEKKLAKPDPDGGEKRLTPSAILKAEKLPIKYQVWRGNVPLAPNTRKSQKMIATDDEGIRAFIKAGIERITSDKALQTYVLRAIAEQSEAGVKVYIPEIVATYKRFEPNPDQVPGRISLIVNAAAMLLAEITPSQEESNVSVNAGVAEGE